MTLTTHFKNTGFFKWTLLTVFSCLIAAISVTTNSWLIRKGTRNIEIPADSTRSASFRWHPLLFRILSVGQYPTSVDILLLRFLTDDRLVKIKDGEETEVSRVLDLATEIDPAFLPFYTAGSNYLAIVRNDRRGALKLLLKGESFLENRLGGYPESFRDNYWPLRWRINFNLGYLYLYEFNDFTHAMESYEKMRRYPDLPEALKLRTDRIRTLEGQVKFALMSIKALKNMNAEDPRILAELDHRREVVLENQRLGEWNLAFNEYRKKRPKHSSVEALFSEFRKSNAIPESDSLGGKVFLSPEGRIDSTTAKVINLGLILGG